MRRSDAVAARPGALRTPGGLGPHHCRPPAAVHTTPGAAMQRTLLLPGRRGAGAVCRCCVYSVATTLSCTSVGRKRGGAELLPQSHCRSPQCALSVIPGHCHQQKWLQRHRSPQRVVPAAARPATAAAVAGAAVGSHDASECRSPSARDLTAPQPHAVALVGQSLAQIRILHVTHAMILSIFGLPSRELGCLPVII